MKYPYIGKLVDSFGDFSVAVFCSNNLGVLLENNIDSNRLHEFEGDFNDRRFKNITTKYLANTKIKFKSESHKSFILKLLEVNGLFYFFIKGDDFIYVTEQEGGNVYEPKQITIPLPPESNVNKSASDSLKNNGDNLIFGDADKCKEWPCVGDEVVVESDSERYIEIKGKRVKVIGICNHSDGDEILTVEHKSQGVFAITKGDWIKKPKTPEEELRYEILDCDNFAITERKAMQLAEWLHSKGYSKKPQ